MTDLRLSRVHAPVTTLGPGRRIGIWFQGCSIGCAGCVSHDTWDPSGGVSVSVAEVVDYFRSKIETLSLTGVTISGGEPFEQPDALLELLAALRKVSGENDVDILCYSGLPLKRLRRQYQGHLHLIDALIPEPFVGNRAEKVRWRGSTNQPMVLLSDLARQRYSAVQQGNDAMQVVVAEQQVWLVGIPHSDDMERLARLVADRGLLLEDVSWVA